MHALTLVEKELAPVEEKEENKPAYVVLNSSLNIFHTPGSMLQMTDRQATMLILAPSTKVLNGNNVMKSISKQL